MKKYLLLALVALTGFGGARVISKIYDLRFLIADANSDSVITEDEFLTFRKGTVAAVDAIHRFRIADANDDGVLNITEFRNSRGGMLGGRATRYEAFQLADTDHDGQLSAQEYAATLPKNRPGRLTLTAFSRRDRDGNGFLSLREFGILVIPR